MLGAYFKADTTLVLAIALMSAAAFHFMHSAGTRKTANNKLLESYLSFCTAFDTVLHFFCIVTVIAFGYTYGFMEAAKLIVVCLVLPIIGMLFALVMGRNNWLRVASIFALPIAVACGYYIFPRLNWFGFF